MTEESITPPLGYMSRVKAISKQEAVSLYSAENIKTVVKYALEQYLRSFFDTNGVNRKYLKVTPTAFNYVSDTDFDFEKDPTKYKLTIDRMQERVQGMLPSIVIADTGMILKTPGFGRSVAQSKSLGSDNLFRVAHQINVFREIPITMLVGTNTQSSTECLSQALHAIMFDLSNMICGRTLRPHPDHDATWCVRLPLQMDAGSTDKNNQSEDTQEQVWTNPLSFSVVFEDSYSLMDTDIEAVVHAPGESIDPSIFVDSVIRVGRKASILVTNMQNDMRLVLNNRNIAMLSEGSRPQEYTLLARQPGTLELQLIQRSENNQQFQGSSIQPKIVLRKSVTLTY